MRGISSARLDTAIRIERIQGKQLLACLGISGSRVSPDKTHSLVFSSAMTVPAVHISCKLIDYDLVKTRKFLSLTI